MQALTSRYRVLRQLGAGELGAVLLARDTTGDREVAVKLMPSALVVNQNDHLRFKAETKAAARLEHPNICAIYDQGISDEGLPFLVMEYAPGESLKAMLRRCRPRVREVINIAIQITAALDAAHARGILHRDLRPGKVMVGPGGVVKVLDLGLAKRLGSGAKSGSSFGARPAHGTFSDTPHYLSPEQALGKEVDGRSDIFSLGVLLYEMIAGRMPFQGKARGDFITNLVNQTPEPLGLEDPLFSPALDRIVFKCLEKNPERRYACASHLLRDLHALRQHCDQALANPVPDRSSSPTGGLPREEIRTRVWSLVRRQKEYAVPVVIGLVVFLVILAALLVRNSKRTLPPVPPRQAVLFYSGAAEAAG